MACTCSLLWLQTWLIESSIFGPRCIDGTPLREVRFSRQECMQNIGEMTNAVAPGCESELLSAPGLAQLVANVTKSNYIKNNLAPSPEESEYFYEDYVDYPYNDTKGESFIEPVRLIDKGTKKPNVIKLQNASSHYITGDTPTIYAAANKTKKPPQQISDSPSSSGFTFFGLPLPSFSLNKLWGANGRMNDARQFNLPIAERKSAIVNHPPFMKIDRPSQPEFQTGGFKPLLPGIGGFKPIIFNQSIDVRQKQNDSQTASNKDNVALQTDLNTKKKDSATTVVPETTTYVNLQTTTLSMYKTLVNMRQQMANLSGNKFVNISKPSSYIHESIVNDGARAMKIPVNNHTKTLIANITRTSSTLEEGTRNKKLHIDSNKKNLALNTESSIISEVTMSTLPVTTTIVTTPIITSITTQPSDMTTDPTTTEIFKIPINRTKEILMQSGNSAKIQTKLSIESTANTIIKTYNNTIQTNKSVNVKEDGYKRNNVAINEDMYAQIEIAPDVPSQMKLPGTLLTDFLVPKQQQQQFRGKSTITKVQSPPSQQQQQEQQQVEYHKAENTIMNPLRSVLDLPTVAAIHNNREIKQVKFVEDMNDKSWYFANYNNSNLTPYVGSRVEFDRNKAVTVEVHKIIFMIPVVIFNIV